MADHDRIGIGRYRPGPAHGPQPARQLRRRDRPQPHSHWPRRRLCLFCSAIFGGAVSVRPGDAGISGALANTSLQIGGSVGTTVLSLVFREVSCGLRGQSRREQKPGPRCGSPRLRSGVLVGSRALRPRVPRRDLHHPETHRDPVSQPAAPEPERHRNHDGLPEPGPRSRQR